jgi:DNA topoisomerase III
MKVIVAEKPSVARSIAECLGITGKHDGYLEGNGYQVTWAFGHLVGLKNPDEYTSEWKPWKMETLPIIPAAFQLKANEEDGAKKQLGIIKSLLGKATEVICATDAGREGELIFRYIVSFAGYEHLPVKRLWISSLTDEAIRTGFNQLKDGKLFDNLYQAAKCRSEADWLVGLNATRVYSIKFGQAGQGALSIGRVQTPVLAMIAQRDTDIAGFVPKDFFELVALYKDVQFQYLGGRFNSKLEAENLLLKLNGHNLVITDVAGKSEKVMPPLLYDLTDLQKDLNVRHGFTAEKTLLLVQALYEKKAVSYPRTDSRYLSGDMKADMPRILESLCGQFSTQIAPLPNGSMPDNRYFNDAKVTDHHAIIPTVTPPKSLSADEALAYQAISLRFISAFYSPCIKQVTTVQAVINGEGFKAAGTIIESQGWQVLYKDDAKDKDVKILPPFVKGETGAQQPKITQGKTTPPKFLTEATLLAMMESAGKTCEDDAFKDAMKNSGLGTPATRASTIETLIKRGFIVRQKNNVVSSQSGRELIKLIPNENLKSAGLTGEWEHKLKQIEQGTYSPVVFMQEIVDFTKKIKTDVEAVDYTPVIANSLGDCPSCNGKVVETKTAYGCSNWKTGCKFVIWKVMAKKTITVAVAKELLAKGETKELSGFKKTKDNAEFKARLKLNNGKVNFSF